MGSNYVKAIDEEIKNRKAENELQFNLANIQILIMKALNLWHQMNIELILMKK